MIYKGNEAARPYKSLGNCTVYSNDGATELETIPWYTELCVKKGDGLYGKLIYPSFLTTVQHQPDTNDDCCIGRFAEPYHSSIQLCTNTDNSKFGFYMQGAQQSIGAALVDFSKEDTLGCKVALGFDMHRGSFFTIESLNSQPAINPNGYDIIVDESLAGTSGLNRVYAGFGGTFLTNKDITELELEMFKGESQYGSSSIDKSGVGSSSNWTLVGSSVQFTSPFTTFNNVKLWYIQIMSTVSIPSDIKSLHIAPRLLVSSSTNNFHVLATNLFYCAYLVTV